MPIHKSRPRDLGRGGFHNNPQKSTWVKYGTFRVQSMENRRNRYSGKYDGLMIKSLFFRGNYAIHGVDLPIGGRVSNGCFHISRKNAGILYDIVYPNRGSTTVIVRS